MTLRTRRSMIRWRNRAISGAAIMNVMIVLAFVFLVLLNLGFFG